MKLYRFPKTSCSGRILWYIEDMFHVAIVDDEQELLFSLKIILEAEGWLVSVYTDPEIALESFINEIPDIIIMDIIMPGKDGLWLCRHVRELSKTVPIIFLSAKFDEIDRIVGLESGGDDYLGKPFSTQELIVRIKVQKRRIDYLNKDRNSDESELILNGFTLNRNAMTLSYEEKTASLTHSEFEIINRLMKRPGTICTREDLLDTVYSRDTFICDRVIDNHIKRIRVKINSLSGTPEIIDTVYGIGYRWKKS